MGILGGGASAGNSAAVNSVDVVGASVRLKGHLLKHSRIILFSVFYEGEASAALVSGISVVCTVGYFCSQVFSHSLLPRAHAAGCKNSSDKL